MASIDAAERMHNMAEELLAAAKALEAGAPLRDADPDGMLLRAVGAHMVDDAYAANTQRATQAEDSAAVREDPFGAFLIDILCEVRTWEGSKSELGELAVEMGSPATVDTSVLGVRHWFSRALADVGVSIHLRDNGSIRIARHQWFFPPRTVKRTPQKVVGRTSSPLILSGYWLSRGIDPSRCVYCMAAPFEEIEHFVPRSRGGSDDMSNLLPSCVACNRGRGDGKWTRDPWEWLREHRPARLAYFQELFNN